MSSDRPSDHAGDINSYDLAAPRPVKTPRVADLQRQDGSIENAHRQLNDLTPNTTMQIQQRRRPSYGTIETDRESFYNLDYPTDEDELQTLLLDPNSRFYARNKPRSINLPKLLPYEPENPRDRAKFLGHIVAHLYIAVKSLDIQGSLSITAKDLAMLRNVAGLSDIDLALDTNLFELINDRSKQNEDDDASSYLSQRDLDVIDDDDDEEEFEEDSEMEDAADFKDCAEEFDSGETTQHKKLPKSAAVVTVRIWTHELLVWLKMKYDMPLSLRMSLAKVYYAICCCRGQHLNLKVYVKAFELLTKNVDLLKQHNFTLPWEPIYLELVSHFPGVDASFEPFEKKDMNLLLKIAERASSFYPSSELPKIFRHLGGRFSIPNASLVLSSMCMLPLTFRKDYDPSIPSYENANSEDIRSYVPALFYMWTKLSKSTGVDSHITSRLGTVAMAFLSQLSKDHEFTNGFGKFGIFSRDEFIYLMNALINSLSINQEKYASIKTKFFHGFSSAIIYSMNGDSCLEHDGIMDQVKNLLNAIESYVHPSNSGDWSRSISKLVMSLIYQFQKRYNMERQPNHDLYNLKDEQKLSDNLVHNFVKELLPVVRTGVNSKRESVVEDYLNALKILAHLDSEQVLSTVLLDLYESLEGVISTHRVVTALRSFQELARYFASTPVYRVHLTRILTLTLPGIDSNDLIKTINTLDMLAAVASFVPFHDLTNGDGDPNLALQFTSSQLEHIQSKLYMSEPDVPFEINEELEVEALKSSTTAFKQIIKTIAERIFLLLRNIPDPSKSDGLEKDLCDCIPKFLFVVIESMSDDIFKSFREEFFNFALDNTIHTISDVIGEICGGIIKRDPKYFRTLAPTLMDKIWDEVKENGAGKARTGIEIEPMDQSLYWNVVILNECIGNAGNYVVELGLQLNELSLFLMTYVKGPVVFGTAYMLNQMLQSVSRIRLNETRLISPAYQEREGIDERCWGGFQFDDYRFSKENLTFDWFTPTENGVRFAVDTFKTHVSKALQSISQVLKAVVSVKKKENLISLELSDELRVYLLYLGYSVSGMAYLFDPSYDEDIPKLNDHKSETLQHRLLLLKQLRDIESFKSMDESESIENVQENLQRIVDDIEGKDIIEFSGELEKTFDVDVAEFLNSKLPAKSFDDLSDKSFQPRSPSSRDEFDKSESPVSSSARATPKIGGIDLTATNPALTFRERKLYTSKYFFGDDIEKRRSNEMYLEVHRTRNLVGRSLHIIAKFMSTHLYDNTRLFKHLLHVLDMWFADVGRERILDHSYARISFSYISDIQKLNRVRKPYTRITFGARIAAYHQMRVALHATSRSMSELEKILLEDLVKFSCSTYVAIADRAQGTLVDAIKRVNGSYNVIIRTAFKILTKALDEENHKKIEFGLSIFELKRIKTKMQGEFMYLGKYIELLHRCLRIDHVEINELALRLFRNICGLIAPPSKTCLIDESLVDTIRPPDKFIDLEIKAVRLAKEKKREVYLERLRKIEDAVVAHEKQNSHWKVTSLNLAFLMELEVDFDMPNDNDVFQLFVKASSDDHPLISRLALKGLTKLLNKLFLLGAFNYNLNDAYNLKYVMRDFKVIDTRPQNGESFIGEWKRELKNLESPLFYIDHKSPSGWLFWDDSMIVVDSETMKNLNLLQEDTQILNGFISCVNKDWFKNIVQLWIADNEANAAFQGTDVFITAGLVTLLSNFSFETFSFLNLLEIIQEVYAEDDKSAHIVVCELLSGILIASKNTSRELANQRDATLVPFLKHILEKDLTTETKNIWTIFSWWVPSHIDCRRFPKITSALIDFKINDDSESALNEATRLSFVRSVVASMTWSFPDPDAVLQLCFDNIHNRYQVIRDQIGSLIAITSFSFYGESMADSSSFIEACRNKGPLMYRESMKSRLFELLPQLFDQIEFWRKEVENLLVHEILKSNYIYAANTVLSWLKQALNTSISVQYQDYVDTHIVPFLLNLTSMKDVCQLGNIEPVSTFKKVSQIPYKPVALERIVKMLEKYSKDSLNNVQCFILGEFTETVFFKNLFHLSASQRQRIFDLTTTLMYHKHLEIREAASSTFSGLIHTSPPADVDALVLSYKKRFTKDMNMVRKKYRQVGIKNISADDAIILHGATLGLGALIHAFAFKSPPPQWIPEILTLLSNKASGVPGVVGRTAKETLGKFKKTRQDTWHVDSKVFNESQIQDLEGVLWKSYFI